jgi:hypothetical protein
MDCFQRLDVDATFRDLACYGIVIQGAVRAFATFWQQFVPIGCLHGKFALSRKQMLS